jgi:23S rRNA (adenine2503-C2)-methyltransferase
LTPRGPLHTVALFPAENRVSSRPNLKDYSIDALRQRLRSERVEAYRAEQIAGWLYQRGVDDPAQMTNLSHALRAKLAAEWDSRALSVESVATSVDGTLKATLAAPDGARIESVLIPEQDRTTLCVSTQVGCAMACSFCATGFLGFQRNLTTAEIIDQVCRMRELIEAGRRITNVVFMGMGEPLLNLPAVIEALRILIDPKGFAMAPRRITVSTVGVVPKLAELVDFAPVNLAVSLHATTDAVRDRLVPLNRRFPLHALLDAIRGLDGIGPRRPVFFEYTLISGVNDSLDDARRLPGLLRGIPCKVNLIPLNPHPDAPFRAPGDSTIDAFYREVAGSGLRATLRRSRGDDIDAACGQLALRRAAGA